MKALKVQAGHSTFFTWYYCFLAQWMLFLGLLVKSPNITTDRFKILTAKNSLDVTVFLGFFFLLLYLQRKFFNSPYGYTWRDKQLFKNNLSTLHWSVTHQPSPFKSPKTILLLSGNTLSKHWPLIAALSGYILNWVDRHRHRYLRYPS